MNRTRIAAIVASSALVWTGVAAVVAVPVEAHTGGIHDNCTNLNKRYPHGLGRNHARDKGGNVTNFKRSTKKYNRANRHNSTLDGDNDHIACEKA